MDLNVAILGAGQIVPDFLLSSKFVDGIKPYTIFGAEKDTPVMSQLAKEYEIEKISTNYDEVLRDEKVALIYVALPNSLHYEFTKKALLAKKHVIIEKPFCSSLSQAKDLFEISEKENVFLFEAIPNIHYPNFKEMKNTLPSLGSIKLVELNSVKYSSRYDEFKKGMVLPAFDPKKDGGALMDMGVYNLHLLVGLFGKPNHITYFPNMEKGIDTSGILLAEYPNYKCSAVAGKDCNAPNCINVMGDKGFIHSTSRSNLVSDFDLSINGQESQKINQHERKIHERLAYEIQEFYDVVVKNDSARYRELKEQTLQVMELLSDIRGVQYE